MIQIKKTILTLVALIAVTTGAWADYTVTLEGTTLQGIAVSSNSGHAPNTTQTVEGITITASNGDFFYLTTYPKGPVVMASSSADNGLVFSAENNIKSIAITFTEMASYGSSMAYEAGAYTYQVSPAAKSFALPKNDIFIGITKVVFTLEGDAPVAASAVTVDWNKTEKTGTFTMPGGNVTLEPEYYPQATLNAAPTAADGAKATTDDLLVSGGTVATITGSDPAAPQGTLMYYVSTSTMTTEALLALDADEWVAEPTAAGITQKCGAFVYYYVKGNDSTDDALNFSDGDISSANVLNVPIYPAPLWNAEFDLTNAPEEDKAGKWSTDIPEGGVVKGTPVTVTYTGDRKVIGVKAEKKKSVAEGKTLAEATVGMLVGSDGKTYAAADKNNLPEGVTAVALVCYVSDGHGLALALADESSSKMTWNTAKSTCSGKTPAVTGCTWKLATKDEWNNMINAAGGFSALRDGFSSVGGTNMLSGSNDYYWSSTTTGSDCAWSCTFSTGNWTDDYVDDYCTDYVRACLAF